VVRRRLRAALRAERKARAAQGAGSSRAQASGLPPGTITGTLLSLHPVAGACRMLELLQQRIGERAVADSFRGPTDLVDALSSQDASLREAALRLVGYLPSPPDARRGRAGVRASRGARSR
jgi:hypothetical protein